MSLTQVILIVLVVAAFALGWWTRGRRTPGDQASRDRPTSETETALAASRLDALLAEALTALQAALALWQVEGDGPSPGRFGFTRRAILAFEQAGAKVRNVELPAQSGDDIGPAHRRAVRAVDLLSEELSAHRPGEPLEIERERKLAAAERMLVSARLGLLRATRRSPWSPHLQ